MIKIVSRSDERFSSEELKTVDQQHDENLMHSLVIKICTEVTDEIEEKAIKPGYVCMATGMNFALNICQYASKKSGLPVDEIIKDFADTMLRNIDVLKKFYDEKGMKRE